MPPLDEDVGRARARFRDGPVAGAQFSASRPHHAGPPMVTAAGVQAHRRATFSSPAPSIGGLVLFYSHRIVGVLCALALLATSLSPALADEVEQGRLRPASRGARQESDLR